MLFYKKIDLVLDRVNVSFRKKLTKEGPYFRLPDEKLNDLVFQQIEALDVIEDAFRHELKLVFQNYYLTGTLDQILLRLSERHATKNWSRAKIEFVNCKSDSFLLGASKALHEKQHLSVLLDGCEFIGVDVLPSFLSLRGYFELRNCYIDSLTLSEKSIKDIHIFNSQINFLDAANGVFEGDFIVSNTTLGKDNKLIDFSGAVFKGMTIFDACSFYDAPQFYGATLYPGTLFRACNFIDVRKITAWRRYSALQKFSDEMNSSYLSKLFHSLELEARYHSYLPKWRDVFWHPEGPEKFFSWVFFIFSHYGRNLWLPAVWLSLITAAAYMFYSVYGGVQCYGVNANTPGWLDEVCLKEQNFYYAIKNLFGPIGFLVIEKEVAPATVLAKVIGVLQAIVSSIIWYLWLGQIRGRFKL